MSVTQFHENIELANRAVSRMEPQARRDRLRPRYHFAPPSGWINDPNGLVQWNGQYHLFYQHNPYGPVWASMHWGHAVSADMIHWRHLPIALAPSEDYDDWENGGCFSGSAVAYGDKIVLFYTGVAQRNSRTVQSQCLAESSDGIHFQKYAQNPIIARPPQDGSGNFRDPKVWFHEDAWYMAVGSNRNGLGKALLYRSHTLTRWEYVGVMAQSDGRYGRMWECPDFFQLEGRDVLLVSAVEMDGHRAIYFTGHLDYSTGRFTAESEGDVDAGSDFYAPQSLCDDRGRRILIGWAGGWDWMPSYRKVCPTAAYGWQGFMSIPRTVCMRPDGGLAFASLAELSDLRGARRAFPAQRVCDNEPLRLPVGDGVSYEIEAAVQLEKSTAGRFRFALRASQKHCVKVEYDCAAGELAVDCSQADDYGGGVSRSALPRPAGGELDLHIFVDTCSVEVFACGGRVAISCNIYPTAEDNSAVLSATGGYVCFEKLAVYQLANAAENNAAAGGAPSSD